MLRRGRSGRRTSTLYSLRHAALSRASSPLAFRAAPAPPGAMLPGNLPPDANRTARIRFISAGRHSPALSAAATLSSNDHPDAHRAVPCWRVWTAHAAGGHRGRRCRRSPARCVAGGGGLTWKRAAASRLPLRQSRWKPRHGAGVTHPPRGGPASRGSCKQPAKQTPRQG